MIKIGKYEKGDLITSFDVLMKQKTIWLRNRVVHEGWFYNWQLKYIERQMKNKEIYETKLKEVINNENNL